MSYTDRQKAAGELLSAATNLQTAAAKLEEAQPRDILAALLPKALEPQPGTFELVLRSLGGMEMSATFGGFLASPAGAAVEPGTAQNLVAEAAYFDASIKGHLLNLAQSFADAVAQVMAKGGAPQGEQGEQQQGGGQ